ncbi:SDR family oxidoreductase [Vineibacter terrae]|uniref:SDR family oxidoreductase n=1 Tax=Vineibacter terrae TaxID=2586908 RepID=A0A5C8PVU0_9HYPH|nr:SDR family oxidoreductase [Vineibacter terrae]TXL82135.1 SDR family oxidoreductase [Vineibacter terrae]
MAPTDRQLSQQRAIVTGASSGIGAQIARVFARAGATVGVNYRGAAAAADATLREVRDGGGQAMALPADVSKEEDARRMFDDFAGRFGGVDILVANAGLQKDAAAAEMTLEAWRTVIDINLTGQFLCAREAVRRFLAQAPPPQGRARGKIICMSSVHEVIPWAGHINYAASKGGVMLMMKSLAQEVADKKIRVNGIAPGAIRTPINEAVWSDPAAMAALLRLIPYGRIGEPDDVARAALWLASDDSDYVTGTTLFVDGGMTLYPAFRDNG